MTSVLHTTAPPLQYVAEVDYYVTAGKKGNLNLVMTGDKRRAKRFTEGVAVLLLSLSQGKLRMLKVDDYDGVN